MKAQEIRDRFTHFFEKNLHEKISSSALIPENDPTLLFANAGMNQFKDYFTGKAVAKNKRAVTIQKVVRAGGKHNDLENVGYTARHHTFFEMLGNFSFGDYFKKEAIEFAWKFLTEELKMEKDKLMVTVHYSDDEARQIWHKHIGLPLDRIFPKGDKDNFWEMGDTGPCGPCTEIFFDHGEKYAIPDFKVQEGGDILDDDKRYVEIWNLVFMQYEKTPEGKFPLPKPSIDTGAGLERVTAAMQGVWWNYDTDIFVPIIKEIEKLSGKKYTDEKYCSSMRIVADHIRSTTMLITDGAIPSNEGRGYVLRRIIRRAIRHLKELGVPANSFYKLVPVVFETLGKEYPQNAANSALAVKFLQLEEKKFLETLDVGLKFLKEAMTTQVTNKQLVGAVAFKLYDTFGFPLDLTEVILQEQGLTVDHKGFEKCMQDQRAQSQKSWKGGVGEDKKVFYTSKEKHGETKFTGYKDLESNSKLLDIIKLGEKSALVFNTTPFYAESGGQEGDVGAIYAGDVVVAHISDTQKPVDNFHIHLTSEADHLEIGQTYKLVVDKNKRNLTMRNHSATHLLQAALVQTLGNHVKQAGSSVGADRLRFDFAHPQAVTSAEIKVVEDLVNSQIKAHLEVAATIMTKDQAMTAGATALFGEKYGDEVRVLNMGKFSQELCGGTHVKNTGDIGHFLITSEGSLSSGVRRIEAVTSTTAMEQLVNARNLVKDLEQNLQEKETKIIEKVSNLQKEIKDKAKEIDLLKEKIQNFKSRELFDAPEKLGQDFIFKAAKTDSVGDLKGLADLFADKFTKGVLVLYADNEDKVSVLIKKGRDVPTVDCGKILKEKLTLLSGKGGGKSDMAQGSGEKAKIKEFIDAVKNNVKGDLKL